jgi:glycosyltransferase involved in cell wall biosynthesis
VWETHIKPRSPARYSRVARRALVLVAVTKHYAEEIPLLWGISVEKVLYTPDAVDVDDFAHPEPKVVARKRLGLPLDKKIVLYAGRIDSWKGVSMLLDASNLVSEDIQIAIIGGTETQIQQLHSTYPRVRFLGYRPYEELPDNQSSADVLVLTGDPLSTVAQFYTSPLKLFTYMASGVPIVAIDLPAFRDVLSEQEAFFCAPSAAALAEALEFVMTHTQDAGQRAERARQKVQGYSWIERARAISAFCGTASKSVHVV